MFSDSLWAVFFYSLIKNGIGPIYPDAESGYQASKSANKTAIGNGNIGAGAGATVGKLFGMKYAMKAGLGTASLRIANTDIVAAAIVAVNALGDIYDPSSGCIIAGAYDRDKKMFLNTSDQIKNGYYMDSSPTGTNTTIGVIATNASLTKVQLTKISQMAHAGLARTINPVHTPFDGDTIFSVSTDKTDTIRGAARIPAQDL